MGQTSESALVGTVALLARVQPQHKCEPTAVSHAGGPERQALDGALESVNVKAANTLDSLLNLDRRYCGAKCCCFCFPAWKPSVLVAVR